MAVHGGNPQRFEDTPLYASIYEYVKQYMSKYDMSHDFNHILRVLGLAKHMYKKESAKQVLDEQAVICAALLHDVGDKKYAAPGESAEKIIFDLLAKHGCSDEFAGKVSTIAVNVSFSNEVKNAEQVRQVLATCPELGVVQDADRLDAIGAVGIARCVAFGAAKAGTRGLQGSIDHFTEKLENLESMMKTDTGRGLARERTERLKSFRSWWEEESAFAAEML